MEEPKKIRTFVALKTPPEWDAAVGEIQAQLKKEIRNSEIKWVDPEQIHITLRFLGYILPDQIQEVTKALDQAAAESDPFAVTLTGIGCFPSVRRPRVLWVGVKDPAQCASALQAQVTNLTQAIGEKPEDRPFT